MTMDDKVVGFVCCLVAGVLFGTNYIPIKHVDCGDGFFFSLQMSVGIVLVGILVGVSPLTGSPRSPAWGLSIEEYYPLAAVGGACWMLGNLLVPTVVRRIGLGLGLTIWDLSNMMMGWATGMFGLFGVWKEHASNLPLNISGVALCAASLVCFVAAAQRDMREEDKHQPDIAEVCAMGCHDGVDPRGDEEGHRVADERRSDRIAPGAGAATGLEPPSLQQVQASACRAEIAPPPPLAPAAGFSPSSCAMPSRSAERIRRSFTSFGSSLPPKPEVCQRGFCVGLLLALTAGCLFGYTFTIPVQLMQCGAVAAGKVTDHALQDICRTRHMFAETPHSTNAMDYVLSHFCGILAMGVVAFVAYAAARGRHTYAPVNLIMPSLVSGAMWGMAQAAWFMANAKLSLSIAFPIISTLPGLVALACGHLFFGELRTTASRRCAAAGVCLRVPGVVFIAMSTIVLTDESEAGIESAP